MRYKDTDRDALDLKMIAEKALSNAASLVEHWLPGGHREGDEYLTSKVIGLNGRSASFKINMRTGFWTDLAGESGRDLIGLSVYLDGGSPVDAARKIAKELGLTGGALDRDQAAASTDARPASVEKKTPSRKSQRRKASDTGDGRQSQTDLLIGIARRFELFASVGDETVYAAPIVDGHREVWPLKSPGFRKWLTRQYYLDTGQAPNAETLKQATATLEAIACHEGQRKGVFLRRGEQNGRLYLDLCDKAWRVIEVDAAGWRVMEKPPVNFVRMHSMLPLPEPQEGGDIDDLRQLLTVASERDFQLIVAWPSGPFPILALTGEQGAAKTSTARILRSLVDPHTADIRRPPQSERDLFIAAAKTAILAYDNLSSIPGWLSDAFCVLSTGGTFSTRQLHTDSDEVHHLGCLPIMTTSIGDVITRSDLASRAITVCLAPISDDARKSGEELSGIIAAKTPRILGALLDALSEGLRTLPSSNMKRLPRMADFVRWTSACEGALWERGSIERDLEHNAEEAVDAVLEADAVAVALIAFIDNAGGHWKGKGERLLRELTAWAPHGSLRGRSWPCDPTRLSARLTIAAPALRKRGVVVERGRSSGERYIEIRREGGLQ